MGSKAVSSAVEAANGTNEGLICESADLLYHLLVLLTSKGLRIEDLANELKNRHKK
jgi:phosphoribosyl-ATP pyrophosphohydrolase/phosphoribosyl-AMP cyclohydrolase